MSEVGLHAALQRLAPQSVAYQQQQLQLVAPGLARVPLPPRGAAEERTRPRKAAVPMDPATDQAGGESSLSTGPVANAFQGQNELDPDAYNPLAQARTSARQLPSADGNIVHVPTSRGMVHLTMSTWLDHIVPAHVTNAPTQRGKRTTTYWPVIHSATGVPTMTQDDVLDLLSDTLQNGDWYNGHKGTLVSTYDLPENQARQFGVSEVMASVSPKSRVLSFYPVRGSNVLGVREITAEEQAAVHSQQSAGTDQRFTTNVPETSFG